MSEINVSILEPEAFKGKDIIVTVSERLSEAEMSRLGNLLHDSFLEARGVLILGSEVDMELPVGNTLCEAVPLEHFISHEENQMYISTSQGEISD